jgi:hypothetical protein
LYWQSLPVQESPTSVWLVARFFVSNHNDTQQLALVISGLVCVGLDPNVQTAELSPPPPPPPLLN